jgi:nitrogen-specific signal transduction histidine kinase
MLKSIDSNIILVDFKEGKFVIMNVNREDCLKSTKRRLVTRELSQLYPDDSGKSENPVSRCCRGENVVRSNS